MSSPTPQNATATTTETPITDAIITEQVANGGIKPDEWVKFKSMLEAMGEEKLSALTQEVKEESREKKLLEWKEKNNYKSPEKVKEEIADIVKKNPEKMPKNIWCSLRELLMYQQPIIPADLQKVVPKAKKSGTTKSGKARNFNYVDSEKCKTNIFCRFSNEVNGTIPRWEEGGVGGHLGCKHIMKSGSKLEEHMAKCKNKYRKEL